MSRLQNLEELCLKMVYVRDTELASSDCNETVILAINIAKRTIYREYLQIARQRQIPVSAAIQ